MSTRIFGTGLLLILFTAAAQDRAAERLTESKKTSKSPARTADSTAAPTTWEVHKNIAVEPGKTVLIDSDLDFTSTPSVAVTLRSTTTSAADLGSLSIYAYWSVPDADHYNAAEGKRGSEFLFSNTGGTVFQAHGSQFRLVLRNDTDRVLSLEEIVFFGRSR